MNLSQNVLATSLYTVTASGCLNGVLVVVSFSDPLVKGIVNDADEKLVADV